MATLVAQSVNWGLTGLEYFLGVPGSLGGAVVNNAHYLSALISQHIVRVHVVQPDGELVWLSAAASEFGYDHSRFQHSKEIVVAVEFLLQSGTKAESQALIAQATHYRATTQPLGIPSSGCIFQNTPNTTQLQQLFPQFAQKTHVPGGFLIDQAGMKGTRVGALEVSHKHAAFIVNHGGGTAKDLLSLIALIKTTVKARFGVDLVEEVFFLA
jgi:UDP-N-acetylmuramate dehydrogenase